MGRRIASLIVFTLVVLWLLAIGGLVRFVVTSDQSGHPPASVLAFPLVGIGVVGLVVLLVVWLILLLVLRERRIKRGVCRKCAYDLRGSPPEATACPECGAARPDA